MLSIVHWSIYCNFFLVLYELLYILYLQLTFIRGQTDGLDFFTYANLIVLFICYKRLFSLYYIFKLKCSITTAWYQVVISAWFEPCFKAEYFTNAPKIYLYLFFFTGAFIINSLHIHMPDVFLVSDSIYINLGDEARTMFGYWPILNPFH